MKKQLMCILALTLGLVSLTGCVGTPVVYGPAMEQETSQEDETIVIKQVLPKKEISRPVWQ